MGKRGFLLGVDAVFASSADILTCGIADRAKDTDQVSKVEEPIAVGVHLLDKHVAVGFRDHEVIVAEEYNKVKSVDLHAPLLVNPLEHINCKEILFLSEHMFLEFSVTDAVDLLCDDSRHKLLSFVSQSHFSS